MARLAQSRMATSSKGHQNQIAAEIYQLRHEQGVQKVADFAREARAAALHTMVNGSKETFEANQAEWRAWDRLVGIIEAGPKVPMTSHPMTTATGV